MERILDRSYRGQSEAELQGLLDSRLRAAETEAAGDDDDGAAVAGARPGLDLRLGCEDRVDAAGVAEAETVGSAGDGELLGRRRKELLDRAGDMRETEKFGPGLEGSTPAGAAKIGDSRKRRARGSVERRARRVVMSMPVAAFRTKCSRATSRRPGLG